jgi:cytochrome c
MEDLMRSRSIDLVGSVLICLVSTLSACAGGDKPSTVPGATAPDTTASSTTDAAPEPADFSAQVALGERLYGENCASCHGASGEGGRGPRVVGLAEGALPLDPPADRKVRAGRFITVADVATFVVENMPPGRGGSLTTEQYLAILAFDLKANGIDLGQEKLTMAKAEQLTIPR